MEMHNDQKVEVSKQFSVTVEKLFQAWNDPEQLKQWWKPMGNHLKHVTNELKVNGTVRYTFNDDTLVISGTYEEVKENEKLAYTWNWEFPGNPVKNAAYKLDVQFSPLDGGSKIHINQQSNQIDENSQVNEEGWNKGLSDLESFLGGQMQQNDEPTHPGIEEAGYQERPEQQKVGGG